MSSNMIASLRGITFENAVEVAEALIEQNISRIDVPPASPARFGSSLYAAALRQASVPHG